MDYAIIGLAVVAGTALGFHFGVRIKDKQVDDALKVCGLNIEEIKRLEAVRDALTEELEQERADRLIKEGNAKLRRSEGSKRGWMKRRAA
jgi:hypothetical protein